jgi:hypothetical protein
MYDLWSQHMRLWFGLLNYCPLWFRVDHRGISVELRFRIPQGRF